MKTLTDVKSVEVIEPLRSVVAPEEVERPLVLHHAIVFPHPRRRTMALHLFPRSCRCVQWAKNHQPRTVNQMRIRGCRFHIPSRRRVVKGHYVKKASTYPALPSCVPRNPLPCLGERLTEVELPEVIQSPAPAVPPEHEHLGRPSPEAGTIARVWRNGEG